MKFWMFIAVLLSMYGLLTCEPLINGSFTIAGLFQINSTTNGQCQVDPLSVKTVQAVKWVFKTLNDNDYLPGVTIGFEVFPTYGLLSDAVNRVIDLMIKARNDKQQINSPPLVGLIGPGYSREVERTSNLLSSETPDDKLLQLSFAATASSLSNADVYSNLFRVIQSDELQTEVIVALMKKLKWNYIAIIFDNDIYGTEAKDALVSKVAKHSICVAKTVALEVDVVNLSQLKDDIRGILTNSESPISGVVVFARGDNVENVVEAASDLSSRFADPLSFIFSEAIGLSDIFFKNNAGVIHEAAKGSFVVSPAEIKIQEFEDYWFSLMQNKSLLLEESKTNSFLLNVYESYSGCLPTTYDNCPGLSLAQQSVVKKTPLWTAYALKAAYVVSKLLKETHNDLCSGETSICRSMQDVLQTKKGYFVKRLRTNRMAINFSQDFPSTPSALTNMSLLFDSGNDVSRTGGLPDYEVFQYKKRSDDSESFAFEKIGTYNSAELSLQLSQIRDYKVKKDGTSWPDITLAQCKEGRRCTSCILEESYESVYLRDGDVILGGIFPVYNGDANDPLLCSNIRTSEGSELVMAMEYIVDLINNRTKPYDVIFPGKTVGILVINSCDQPLLIQNKLTKLFGKDLELKTGEVIDVSKILGFIAAYSSSLSVVTSHILAEYRYTQVAYAATAVELSDREKYPYFSRTVTPDTKQAKAIISIVTHKRYASNYIQIVYSKGVYGESGLVAIKQEATKRQVCIVQEVVIDDGDNFNAILQKLRRHPFAKVVILLIRAHQVDRLVSTLDENMVHGEFLFIASEAWGFRPGQFTDKLKFVGTVILALQLPENSNFTSYLRSKDVSLELGNPWLLPYMTAKYSCHINSSFDKTFTDPCSAGIRLGTSDTYRQDIWTPFVLRASQAFLSGSYEAFKEICGPNASKLCDGFRRDPSKVRNYTVKQEVDVDGSGALTRVFDDNGDGNVGYTIFNLKRKKDDRSSLEYVQVGMYDLQEDKLDLDTTSITLPDEIKMPSTCPNEKACESCKSNTSTATCTSSDSGSANPVLGAFVGIFLVVNVVLAVIVVLLYRRLKEVKKDEIYDDELYDRIENRPTSNTAYGVAHPQDNCTHIRQLTVPSRHQHIESRLTEARAESREGNSYLHLSQISSRPQLIYVPDDSSSDRYSNTNKAEQMAPVDNQPEDGGQGCSPIDEKELGSIKLNKRDESNDVSVYLTPPSPETVGKRVQEDRGFEMTAIRTDSADSSYPTSH